jgi:hypothetical protein
MDPRRTRESNCNSSVDAVILEEPIDDREMAVLSSRLHGVVANGRRIDALRRKVISQR